MNDALEHGLSWPAERLSANVSMLFADVPLLARPAAAAAAGFGVVESWWPFVDPEPEAADLDRFAESFTRAGVRVASLNFLTGDRARGERGLPARSEGVQRFLANVPIALDIAARIGARTMNVLYGNVDPKESPAEQMRRAARAIARAAEMAADRGIGVMIEPISSVEAPEYALRTVADVRRVVDAVAEAGGPAVGICYDLYHLGHEDPGAFDDIARDVPVIRHVQVADLPGRGRPGSGRLPIDRILRDLAAAGYDGWVGLEYRPGAASVAAAGLFTSEGE